MATLTIFSHVPLDWVVLAVVAVVIAFDATRSGTSRAAALALSLPLSVFFYTLVAQTAVLATISGQFAQSLEKAAFFGIIFVVLFLLMYRVSYGSFGGVGIVPGVIAGVAAAIVLAVTWLQVPALQSVWQFGTVAQAIFAAQYRFWWLLGAYIALAGARS